MTVTHKNTLLTGCPVKRVHIRNKGYLFGLNLSFIGWALLAILAVVLMTDAVILSMPYVNIYITSILQIFLLIPTYILMSYINTANGLFYEIASGHLRQVDNQMY